MTINTLVKNLIGVNNIKVTNVRLVESDCSVRKIVVEAQPHKNSQGRCPYCDDGKKLSRYDSCHCLKSWRGLDCGDIVVEI